jgi:hypothetical protein
MVSVRRKSGVLAAEVDTPQLRRLTVVNVGSIFARGKATLPVRISANY